MKVIKDTSKGTEEYTDIVSYMEDKYPEMTSEFKKIQQEQYQAYREKIYQYSFIKKEDST